MAQKVGTVTSELILDTRKATQAYERFERTVRNRGKDNFLSGISADARDFENSLGKATNRVVAFGAAAAIFTTLSKAAGAFAASIVQIDNSLAKINVNLGQSSQGLKKFGSELFNIARETGQTFEVTAKAAEELARQGLGAQETTKRLKDALILSRIAGLDSAAAVETLTAAINSFNQEALTSTEVVNKFAAVDTKFAVSSRDLAEAVSRVGSTAQSAGVGINELIGLVTSLQQTTSRGGATIGNGLKTIFTRIQAAPETVSALQSIGVAIKNTDGSLRDAISILRDYGVARQKVSDIERASLDRTVAGTFQINLLKAALGDLSKEYSIYGSAVRTASNATDEAITKNIQLNQTIAALLNSTSESIKQFFANVGNQQIGPVFAEILKLFEKMRSFFSGDSGSALGESLGNGLLKGISNVISGPGLAALFVILGSAFKKVITTIAQEARTLLSINNTVQTRANIQRQIVGLLQQATEAEKAEYIAASSVLAKKEQILAIQARINQESLAGSPLVNSFQTRGPLGFGSAVNSNIAKGNRYLGGVPSFANPLSAAISREKAAGVPANSIYVDRDARVANFANPMGLLVANTRDEPLGGFQGVNRVLAQGGNPKTNGLPNFAKTPENPELQGLLGKLNAGGTLRKKELDVIRSVFQKQIVAQKLGSFSNVSDQILAQNKDLAQEIQKSVGIMIQKIYEQNAKNLTNKLKQSALKRIGPVLDRQANIPFGNSDDDLQEVQKLLGRRLKSVEKQVFEEYSQKVSVNRKSIVDAANTRSIQYDASQGVSRESFMQGRRESARNQAFDNLKSRFVQGGTLTNAQSNFLRSQFRNEAGELAKQRIAPGSKAGVTNSFVAFDSQRRFDELAAQRQKFAGSIQYSEEGPIGPSANDFYNDRINTQSRFERSQNRRREKAASILNRRENLKSRALLASFALPFAGAFVEPGFQAAGINTKGGTGGGVASGALGGAAIGAGYGGIFGPAGLAVGAALGALGGALSKTTKSFEELSNELDEARASEQKRIDQLGSFIESQSQLNDAIGSGDLGLARKLSGKQNSFLSNSDVAPGVKEIIAKAGGNSEVLEKLIATERQKLQSNVAQDNLTKALDKFLDVGSTIFGPNKEESKSLISAITAQAESKGINIASTDTTFGPQVIELFKKLGIAINPTAAGMVELKKALEIAKQEYARNTEVIGIANKKLKEFEISLININSSIRKANFADVRSGISSRAGIQRNSDRDASAVDELTGLATNRQQIGLRGNLQTRDVINNGREERLQLEEGFRNALRDELSKSNSLTSAQKEVAFGSNTSTSDLKTLAQSASAAGNGDVDTNLAKLIKDYEQAIEKNILATTENVKTIQNKTDLEQKAAEVIRRQTSFSQASLTGGSEASRGLNVLGIPGERTPRKQAAENAAFSDFFETQKGLGANVDSLQGIYNTTVGKNNLQKFLTEAEQIIKSTTLNQGRARDEAGNLSASAVRTAAGTLSRYRDPTKAAVGRYLLDNLDAQQENIQTAGLGQDRIKNALAQKQDIRPEEMLKNQIEASTLLQKNLEAFSKAAQDFTININTKVEVLNDGIANFKTDEFSERIQSQITAIANQVMAIKGKPMPPAPTVSTAPTVAKPTSYTAYAPSVKKPIAVDNGYED